MLVLGNVKCLHCGFENGRWVGRKGALLTVGGLRDRALAPGDDPAALVHCSRCAGPVFLDDASAVLNGSRLRRIRRLREQIAALDAHRAA
jgi:hypothetical protein